MAEHGVDDLLFADELTAVFQKERRIRHIVYPDVVHVLQALREKFKLGLLTNGAPDLQREKLQGSELGVFFEAVIISGEVGIGKPEPRIFDLVCERLNVGSETAVMVGDSIGRDISGAQRAGLRAIWFNRDNRERNGSVNPDYEVESLNELCEYLSYIE